MKTRFILIAILPALVCCSGNNNQRDNLDTVVETTVRASLGALERAVEEIQDTLSYPTYATRDELKWRTKSSKNWVSGFWPGCLWYASILSGDQRFE